MIRKINHKNGFMLSSDAAQKMQQYIQGGKALGGCEFRTDKPAYSLKDDILLQRHNLPMKISSPGTKNPVLFHVGCEARKQPCRFVMQS